MSKFHIKIAADFLRIGGIIAYPTESVFGLGCDPHNIDAIHRLLLIKNRPEAKGLIIVAASIKQLEPFIKAPNPQLLKTLQETWPGPTNWLLPPNSHSPAILRGSFPLQAVRVSKHPLIQDLCYQFGGAIVSTSANKSKRAPAKKTVGVYQRFGTSLDYVLSGNVGGLSMPCEIRNGLNNEVIRSSTQG